MAVTVSEALDTSEINDIATIGSVAEIRADKFASVEPDYLAEQAKRFAGIPLLLTIRYEPEQGGWEGTEQERFELFSDLITGVDGVDIELRSEILRDVVALARDHDKAVLISNHDYKTTQPTATLEAKLDEALILNPDYVKFATTVNTPEEYHQLVDFTQEDGTEGDLITVGMGAYGPLSRIALPASGSQLIYAYAGDQAAAAGQMHYRETHEQLKRFYPDYAALFE
jgi:3-dehydroquinate dehydratase-1